MNNDIRCATTALCLAALMLAMPAAAQQAAPPAGAGKTVSVSAPFKRPITLNWVPAGTFTMGTPSTETAHRKNESPQTQVTISQGFWAGTHEVTIGQWKALMGTDQVAQARIAQRDDELFNLGAGPTVLRTYFNVEKDGDTMALVGNVDDDLPILWVSWAESVEFAKRLTALARSNGTLPAGYEYRLPTEAEWEYFARAGNPAATHAGDMTIRKDHGADALDGIAWYAANVEEGYSGHAIDTATWKTQKAELAGRAGPRTVGTKAPNAWGIYDVLGNAAEWCLDWDGPLPGGAVTDPAGPAHGTMKIRRGGGWSTFASHARVGYRNAHEVNFRWINLGFRLVLAKPAPQPK